MPHDMVSACIQYDYPQHFTTFFPPFTTSPEQLHAVKSTAWQRWQGLLFHHGESWRWPKRCSEADRSLLTQDPDLLTRKDLWQCGQHGHIKNLEHIPKIWQNMFVGRMSPWHLWHPWQLTSMTTGYRYPQVTMVALPWILSIRVCCEREMKSGSDLMRSMAWIEAARTLSGSKRSKDKSTSRPQSLVASGMSKLVASSASTFSTR